MMKRTAPALAAALALALPCAALAQTIPIEDLTRGMSATLSGTVERIADDDEFILADATGQILVYIGPNPMPVTVGWAVEVTGQMDDDGPLEFYATQITLADGQVVTLAPDE